MLKLNEIIPYSNNTKLHPEEQIDAIRDSIIALKYINRIEVDENNIILSGHGRLKSLYQLDSSGETKVEVIRFTGLAEAQKIAYRIASNKLNIATGFDLDAIGKEFNLLEDTDFFKDTGFSPKEISEIWDKKEDSSELIAQDKTSVISHIIFLCVYNFSLINLFLTDDKLLFNIFDISS